ncbi:MAG TPA: SgcJ/EcaC family oxidoreductase [Candidatus Dormibacteraeota bacterium]|nr:SgcJ/EcaC family oxidoreductase [Candidatus Dormibacteraeota bacterium]
MGNAPDRSGIVGLMNAIEGAWNAGDVKSYARLYALDAAYMTRAGILWKGRKVIERGHAGAFQNDLKGTVLKIRVKRLRFLTAKNAVAHCAVELSGGTQRGAHMVRGVTRFELRKNRTRWEIVAARTREISPRR